MKKPHLKTTLAAGALSAVLLSAPFFPRLIARAAADPAPAQAGASQAATTQSDQTDLSITVYNSDLALVRDVRDIRLPSGVFPLKFMDIAASVNPATVHFRSLSDAGAPLRAGAELRIRSARAAEVAGEIRRPRNHVGACAHRQRHDRIRRREGHAHRQQQRPHLENRK